MVKCKTKYCRNKRAGSGLSCSKCLKRNHKAKDPEAYFYNLLKSNAKRRKKYFDLTLQQFRDFCKETNYIELKGKTAKSASIDRKIMDRGYTFGNLQILSLSANTTKRNEEEYPF